VTFLAAKIRRLTASFEGTDGTDRELKGAVDMTKHQITVVELTDLQSIVISCRNEDCKTQVNLKLGRTLVPTSCPSCGTPYAKEFRHAIKGFLDFYLAVKDAAFKIEFQVKEETASASDATKKSN
jgi:transcription elongation factor Elf1